MHPQCGFHTGEPTGSIGTGVERQRIKSDLSYLKYNFKLFLTFELSENGLFEAIKAKWKQSTCNGGTNSLFGSLWTVSHFPILSTSESEVQGHSRFQLKAFYLVRRIEQTFKSGFEKLHFNFQSEIQNLNAKSSDSKIVRLNRRGTFQRDHRL